METIKRKIKIKSKNKEDAIKEAIKHFDVLESDLEVLELESPNKGFLGLIGKKEGLYEISVVIDEIDVAKDFLGKIIKNLNANVSLDVKQEENLIKVFIKGEDSSLFVGKKGETLDSIQLLTGIVLNKFKKDSNLRVLVDVDNYREKREKYLIDYAKKVSSQVLRYKKTKKLECMNPYERRIIHNYLQEFENINTYSEGVDPYRRLVIEYVGV